MFDHNQKQYRLMLDRLSAFEQGRLRLDTLVNDLEGLLNALENVDSSWKKAFIREWGRLEDARAVALFRGSKIFDEQATQRLLAVVGLLTRMVQDQMK